MSTYAPQMLKWLSKYRPSIEVYRTSQPVNPYDIIVEHDFCKAYTSCLLEIENFPVFMVFCEPVKYHGESIDDDTIYLINL